MSQGSAPQPGWGQQPPPPPGQGQPPGYGPPPGQGQPPGWAQQNPGYNPQPAPGLGGTGGSDGLALTVGLIPAVIGAILVLVSVFSMDFVTVETSGFGSSLSQGLSFDDLRDLEDVGRIEFSGRTGFYIQFTMIFALVAVAASVGGSLFESASRLGVGLSALVLFLHLGAAFLWETAPGESIGPAPGAWLGALGYAALAAGPLIRAPLGGQKNVTHI